MTGIVLAAYRVSAQAANSANLRLADFIVTPILGSGTQSSQPGFANLQLWEWAASSSGLFLANGTLTWAQSSWVYKFHFTSPLAILAGQSISLFLRGDVPSDGGVVAGSVYQMPILEASDLVVMALSSGLGVTTPFATPVPTGSPLTVSTH